MFIIQLFYDDHLEHARSALLPGSRRTQVLAYAHATHGPFPLNRTTRRYVDRGIIPRALSLIFAEFKERSDQQFTCHISYLEIYNEQVRVPTSVRTVTIEWWDVGLEDAQP